MPWLSAGMEMTRNSANGKMTELEIAYNSSIMTGLPGAPAIPGLVFRRLSGDADLPNIAAVINASFTADGNRERITAAGLANSYAHPVNCDPQQDTLLVEVSGKLIGYASTEWRVQDDGAWIHTIQLHLVSAWRGQGLELVMQHEMERCGRVAASADPDHMLHWFASNVPETWQARVAMLRSLAYHPVRHYFEMQRSLDSNLPEVAWPAGIALRPVLPEHYRAIWQAGEECFSDQQDHVAPSENSYLAWVSDPDLDPSLWLVAWAGDQVAGAAINTVHPGAWGETDDLFVRRPWRRRGLGRALLAGSLHLFKARGLDHAGLGVDADNLSGAVALYTEIGYQTYQRVTFYRKQM